jgi:iron(III) transport system ATP-binding protein
VPALRVRGLRKSFGAVNVLAGVDLDVPTGALHALLGPSGCGKTTLLRLVAGFDRPDAGRIEIAGRTVDDAAAGRRAHVPAERRRVGVVPQEGALFPHLDVRANVGFGLPRRDRSGPRVDEVLDLVGMAGYGARMPNELSGGQQQRVALARALAPGPDLVLLDEPFSALDAALRADLRAAVRDALRAAGAAALLVTHDQEEALSIADQVAVMRAGTVVQAAEPIDLYGFPADLGVARFLGDAVVLPGRLRGDVVTCVLGDVPVARPAGTGTGAPGPVAPAPGGAGGDVDVLLRPEQLSLGDPGAGADGVVRDVLYFGHDVLVEVEVGGIALHSRSLGPAVPRVGSAVGVTVRGAAGVFPATR